MYVLECDFLHFYMSLFCEPGEEGGKITCLVKCSGFWKTFHISFGKSVMLSFLALQLQDTKLVNDAGVSVCPWISSVRKPLRWLKLARLNSWEGSVTGNVATSTGDAKWVTWLNLLARKQTTLMECRLEQEEHVAPNRVVHPFSKIHYILSLKSIEGTDRQLFSTAFRI